MRVLQHSIWQRNVTQRRSFFTQSKECCVHFLRNCRRGNGACGATQANGNDFYFYATPNAEGELDQLELRFTLNQSVAVALRNDAVRCVKMYASPGRCGTA